MSSRSNFRFRHLTIETLESRCMLSIGVAPELPGMHLDDPNLDNLRGQVVYLDFDGAKGVDYSGPIRVNNIAVPPFKASASLAGQEYTVIDEVLAQLATRFSGSGVVFTADKPGAETPYSTVYVGGNDDAFRLYGSFLGLAEKVDVGNLGCL